MDERIAESIAAQGTLQSLSAEELSLDAEKITIDPKPRWVRAWVRFSDTPLRVRARAARWTSRAVGIEFALGEREFRTWVWVGAVEDDNAPTPTDDAKYGAPSTRR